MRLYFLMLVLVSATRVSQQVFATETRLGRCLERMSGFMPFVLRLFPENSLSLGACYNTALDEADANDVLVFIHDDVHIDDWMLGQRLSEALRYFDVVGVAGNRRCQPGQLTWYLQAPGQDDTSLAWDTDYLSGAIMHDSDTLDAQARVSNYGQMPSAVQLLDGVFLAVRMDRIRASGARFDAALGFHFYDLDFCRSAQAAGLKLGTWPIAISHASRGESVHSAAWAQSRDLYLQKWEMNA